jgi:hypothetical protein
MILSVCSVDVDTRKPRENKKLSDAAPYVPRRSPVETAEVDKPWRFLGGSASRSSTVAPRAGSASASHVPQAGSPTSTTQRRPRPLERADSGADVDGTCTFGETIRWNAERGAVSGLISNRRTLRRVLSRIVRLTHSQCVSSPLSPTTRPGAPTNDPSFPKKGDDESHVFEDYVRDTLEGGGQPVATGRVIGHRFGGPCDNRNGGDSQRGPMGFG